MRMKKFVLILAVMIFTIPIFTYAYGGGGGPPIFIPVTEQGYPNWAHNVEDIKYRYYTACQKLVKAIDNFTKVVDKKTGWSFIVPPGTFLGCQYEEIEVFEGPEGIGFLPEEEDDKCIKHNPLATLINLNGTKVVVPVCSQEAQIYFGHGYWLCKQACKL